MLRRVRFTQVHQVAAGPITWVGRRQRLSPVTGSCEHHGEFMGVPPTGRAFVLNGQTVLRFRDRRVVERWTTGDMLGLLIRLGAIPAPGD